jgi:hypothetical protein
MRIRKSVTSALCVAWIFLVVSMYYVAHKPFDASNLRVLIQAVAGLGGASLVVGLGCGIGLVLVRNTNLSGIERLAWAAPLGLGALSLVGLALGTLGLLRPWLLWTLTIVGLAATAPTLWRASRSAWSDRTFLPHGRFQTVLAVYCSVILAVALIWSLTPPTAWDSLVYHLTGPKLYLSSGRISHPIDLAHLGFPQLTEMLFTWGMGLIGERAAARIHWFYGTLTVIALVAAGRQGPAGESGWLASAILFSSRTIVTLLGWAYVDLAIVLYATLAFLALAGWTGTDRREEWLTLTGVFAGLALSTKYTALALLPASTVVFASFEIRNGGSVGRNLLRAIRHSIIVGALALLVWAPWLAKNVLLTGNPTYPFFFGGIHWDAWRSRWYDRPGTGLAYTAPWRLLSAPWDATIRGVEGATGYCYSWPSLLGLFAPHPRRVATIATFTASMDQIGNSLLWGALWFLVVGLGPHGTPSPGPPASPRFRTADAAGCDRGEGTVDAATTSTEFGLAGTRCHGWGCHCRSSLVSRVERTSSPEG